MTGSSAPAVSTINLGPKQVVPNLVTVPLGADGQVRLFNYSGEINLLADVVGYFAPSGRGGFVPIDPVRLLDTRDGTGVPAGPVGPGESRDLLVVGDTPLAPADASAMIFNLTGVAPTVTTWVAALPTPTSGDPKPTTSTLNLVPGEVRPNATTVGIGDGGRVRFYNELGSLHLVADAVGYYSDRVYGD